MTRGSNRRSGRRNSRQARRNSRHSNGMTGGMIGGTPGGVWYVGIINGGVRRARAIERDALDEYVTSYLNHEGFISIRSGDVLIHVSREMSNPDLFTFEYKNPRTGEEIHAYASKDKQKLERNIKFLETSYHRSF
jgi:hypothetical protein